MKLTHIATCLSFVVCSLACAQGAPTSPPPSGAPAGAPPAKAEPEFGGGTMTGRPRQGGRAGAAQSFEGAMKRAERGFEALEESALDASTKIQDLESVQNLQSGLVAAKGMCATVKMTPAAKAKYGDDTAKYLLEMRMQLIATLNTSIVLEQAILAGDHAAAKAAVEKLQSQEHASHDEFKPEDEKKGEKKGEKPSAPPTVSQ